MGPVANCPTWRPNPGSRRPRARAASARTESSRLPYATSTSSANLAPNNCPSASSPNQHYRPRIYIASDSHPPPCQNKNHVEKSPLVLRVDGKNRGAGLASFFKAFVGYFSSARAHLQSADRDQSKAHDESALHKTSAHPSEARHRVNEFITNPPCQDLRNPATVALGPW